MRCVHTPRLATSHLLPRWCCGRPHSKAGPASHPSDTGRGAEAADALTFMPDHPMGAGHDQLAFKKQKGWTAISRHYGAAR